MAEQIISPEVEAERLQAILHAARARRRSNAGAAGLFRTHLFRGSTAMAVADINTTAAFVDRNEPVTFRTAIRITGASPTGLVFEFGGATRGAGIGVLGAIIALTAGATGNAHATAVFTNPAAFEVGEEIQLLAAIDPGNGKVRLWGNNGKELARATAVDGSFGGTWAGSDNGSFAAIASGAVAVDLILSNQAPVDFEVIEPLSVYNGSLPLHFA